MRCGCGGRSSFTLIVSWFVLTRSGMAWTGALADNIMNLNVRPAMTFPELNHNYL